MYSYGEILSTLTLALSQQMPLYSCPTMYILQLCLLLGTIHILLNTVEMTYNENYKLLMAEYGYTVCTVNTRFRPHECRTCHRWIAQKRQNYPHITNTCFHLLINQFYSIFTVDILTKLLDSYSFSNVSATPCKWVRKWVRKLAQ